MRWCSSACCAGRSTRWRRGRCSGRYSPTVLTAWATMVGARDLRRRVGRRRSPRTDWARVSWWSWTLMTASSVVCLVLAYVIWYTGVQRLGATRTSAYSNLTPIAAMVVGWLWLGEPMTPGASRRSRRDPRRGVPDPLVAGRADPSPRRVAAGTVLNCGKRLGTVPNCGTCSRLRVELRDCPDTVGPSFSSVVSAQIPGSAARAQYVRKRDIVSERPFGVSVCVFVPDSRNLPRYAAVSPRLTPGRSRLGVVRFRPRVANSHARPLRIGEQDWAAV